MLTLTVLIILLYKQYEIQALSSQNLENYTSHSVIKSLNSETPNLVLSFEENKKNIYLLVYSPEDIEIIDKKIKLKCYTNAAQNEIKRKVKISLVSENLDSDGYPDPLQVYQVKSLEKFMGEYWCEALLKNATYLKSNKIIAYERKEGNEYALRLITTNICKSHLCDLEDFFKNITKTILKEFDAKIRIMEIYQFNTDQDILDVLVHITTGKNYPILDEYNLLFYKLNCRRDFKIDFLRNSEYCFPETTDSVNLKLNWPLTKIHTASIPKEFCLIEDGTPITRRCQGDFLHGAQWAPFIKNCSKKSVSKITETLKEIATYGNLNPKIWEKIKEANLTLLDFYYLTLYLEKMSTIETTATLDLINKLMTTDEKILKQSQTYLNLTDTILETIEDIFTSMEENQASVLSVTQDNLIVHVTNPFQSNISGILLYKNFSLKNFYRNEKFQNINLNELELAVYVPEMILEQLYNETENFSEIAIITVIFYNDRLFVDENFNSGSLVVSVSIPGYGSYLKSSIKIIFNSDNQKITRKCGFWDKGKKENRKKGEWSTLGSNYKNFNQTNLHLCSYIHLTHFALLVMSDRKTIIDETEITKNLQHSTEYNLEIITLIGSCFSVVGILGIFITAVSYQKWRARIGTKILLNLSVPILLEITCIQLSEIKIFKNSHRSCKILGIILHYLVLSKFFWMLVYALLQYYRFVKVLGTIPKNLIFKSILVGWGIPLLVVFLCAVITSDVDYDSKSYEFCYPRDLFLYIFVLVPIGLIIFANLIIYFLVMYNISYNSDSCATHKMLKLRMYLALLLFSVLGLPWLFGILAELIAYSQFKIFLFYTFCITATFQGFILFLFYIVLNRETRDFWKRIFHGNVCKL